jgi:hypothetical protein
MREREYKGKDGDIGPVEARRERRMSCQNNQTKAAA